MLHDANHFEFLLLNLCQVHANKKLKISPPLKATYVTLFAHYVKLFDLFKIMRNEAITNFLRSESSAHFKFCTQN